MADKNKKSVRQKLPDLALFDLDRTLLSGDSDYAWGCFLEEMGAVDKHHQKQNAHFYHLYQTKKLDIHDYIRFALEPLVGRPKKQLLAWRRRFIATVVRPMISQSAQDLIKQHKSHGDVTIIVTATNNFITQPIAKLFAVDYLIATEIEEKNGAFTGGVHGVPCFQEGKVSRFRQWLKTHNRPYGRSWFYSDSINDLPLLEYVDRAVVVNGDQELLQHAQARNWPCLSLDESATENNRNNQQNGP